MKHLCIYHKNCADGFGAALSVKRFLDRDKQGEDQEYLAAHYGDEAPDVTGKHVYIVDFSYPREVLINMKEQAASIVVLDHHKTAQANLDGLTFCHFNMNMSGAVMAWEYFNTCQDFPDLINYIEDRDLWRWQLPQSKEYSAGLQLNSMDFDVWEKFLDNDNTQHLINDGKTVLAYQNLQIKRVIAQDFEMISIAGYEVPCINTTQLISEIGNELSKGHPFAAMYFETDNKRVYSLRSASDGIDVSAIAKQYGGGGHFHAAGFSVDKPKVDLSL